MKTTLIALCLTSIVCSGRAEKTPPAITLKQKSSFAASDVRNPFWPIGWTKPNPKTTAATLATPVIMPSSFTLTSVTMGAGARFAILNGKVLQEGQQFGLQIGNQVYQVTVQAIADGQVVLAYEGGQVVVPLRRK